MQLKTTSQSRKQLYGSYFAGFMTAATIAVVWLSMARPHSVGSRQVAEETGMDVYCEREPFTILVPKQSSGDAGFTLLAETQRIVVTKSLGDDHGHLNASVLLGDNSSFYCVYRPNAAGDLLEFTVALKNLAFTDLNADGTPDLRVTTRPKGLVEVWYEREWREVMLGEGDKYRKRLQDGGEVVFARKTGTWEEAVQND